MEEHSLKVGLAHGQVHGQVRGQELAKEWGQEQGRGLAVSGGRGETGDLLQGRTQEPAPGPLVTAEPRSGNKVPVNLS